MSSPKSQMTFGIELEFMTPVPKHLSALKSTASARLNVAKRMAESTSLPVACLCLHLGDTCAICSESFEARMYGNIRVLSDGLVVQAPGTQMASNYFLFQSEHLDDRGALNRTRNWPGVEVSTPVFKYSELTDGLPLLSTAISALRNMDVDISADESCGMHVNVGFGGQGMTLTTAKKITSLVMLLEGPLFAFLCGKSRLMGFHSGQIRQESRIAKGDGPTSMEAESFAPLPDIEPMETYIPPMEAIKPGVWNEEGPDEFYKTLQTLWSLTSVRQLAILLCKFSCSRAGLAFSLRDTSGNPQQICGTAHMEKTPSTVEFRYAQMSFDIPFIRNWTELVCRVVQLSQLEANEYKGLYRAICDAIQGEADGECPFWKKLLQDVLGLAHQVPFWEVQRQMYREGREIAHLDENLIIQAE